MDSTKDRKRKPANNGEAGGRKRQKGKKKWMVPRSDKNGSSRPVPTKGGFEPGDAGIWATCDMKKEARSVVELRDLFEEHARRLYQIGAHDEAKQPTGVVSVEDEVQKELEELRKVDENLFTSVRLDTQCLIFFKTIAPIDPVAFVVSFCKDAFTNPHKRHTRSVKRLTPMTLIGKATANGIDEVAAHVLAPHFHSEGVPQRKFAIRVNIRNHDVLKRDDIIRQVASVVGPGHKVDLKNYDLLILIELYKNICGMSVVTDDYESLKRFNLAEAYEPIVAESEA